MNNNRFLAVAALILIAASASAAERHCQLQTLGEFDAAVRDGQVITTARINGKPLPMVLDTGSDTTVLFQAATRSLGLNLRDTGMTSYGVGGASRIYSARLKSFAVGQLSERDVDLAVTDGSLGAAKGVIGAPFLLQADVEFDLPHGKIRFFKPVDCQGDEVVYWGQAYAVAPMAGVSTRAVNVRVEVNGHSIIAELDSGASESVMTPQGAQAVGLARNDPTLAKEGSLEGFGPATEKNYVGRFDSFSFGEETIHHAALHVADLFGRDKEKKINDLIPTAVFDEPEMLLGADFLEAHRVFIAREQHKVYVSYEGGPVFRPPHPAVATTQAK